MAFCGYRKKIVFAWVAFAMLLLIGSAQATAAELINIQFQSTGPYNPEAPAYTGAAVIGGAGDAWNHITAASGTDVSLRNSKGGTAGTGATMSWGGSGLFSGYNNSYSNSFGGGTYDALMNSYLYLSGGTEAVPQVAQTISFNQLAANTSYDLYVYTEGAHDAAGRNLSITINGNTITTTHASGTTNTGTFVEGENYIKFTGVASNSGALSFTYKGVGLGNTGGKPGEANINGIQLRQPSQTVPEPSTFVLMGIGGMLIAFRLKKSPPLHLSVF